MPMGRKRTSDQQLLPGMRAIGGRLYWQPPTERERDLRRGQGLPASVPLGAIVRVRGRIELTEQQRKLWGELAGHREPDAKPGTMAELFDDWRDYELHKTPKGKPRADETVRYYKHALKVARARFADVAYGKTEHEASRGRAIGTVDVQRFVKTLPSKGVGNHVLAVMRNVFNRAIREGRTTYNPCDKAVKNHIEPRTRAPMAWEVEALQTLASPVVCLMMDYEAITGDRIREVLGLRNAHKKAEGIEVTRKGKRVETWEWSPRLRAIADAAAELPGATKFPASPLFPNRRGRPYAYKTFNGHWNELQAQVNAELAATGIIDPATLAVAPGLVIEEMHFHDLRSKVHDDAEDRKRGSGAEQIGDTPAVAGKHYARRPKVKQPLE